MLSNLFGARKPLAQWISTISDMDELLTLWGESRRTPRTRAVVEARMAEVINALPIDIDNIEKLPAWFITILSDELLLPLVSLRELFEGKAQAIYLRLTEAKSALAKA